jgi:hypothetical protein
MSDYIISEFISGLRRDSYASNCFIYTNNNDIIPVIKINFKQDEIVGNDFFNSINIRIKIDSIVRYDTTPDSNSFYKENERQFKIIRDACESDNLKLDPNFIYKDIPLYQKIISLHLSKQYNDISITELKNFWKIKINQNCDKFLGYVDSELSTCTIDMYKKELLVIKDDLLFIKSHKDLNSLETKDKVCSYWPSILSPSPNFIKPQD